MIKTEEVQGLLDSISSYTDKKNKQINAAAAYIVGGKVEGKTTTGRYKVKIGNETCELWPIDESPRVKVGDYEIIVPSKTLTRIEVNENNHIINELIIPQNNTKITITVEDKYQPGDLVFVIYWGDLTNGKILCKNR